ncbi:hypothetical protein ACFVW2_26985 [Streptomyces sp. NPDC058171]
MTELVEFDDFQQVELLLRAAMELKFELSEDDEILNGSPVYARALTCLREGLISGVRAGSVPGKAQSYVEWYRLSGHPHRAEVVARRASRIRGGTTCLRPKCVSGWKQWRRP